MTSTTPSIVPCLWFDDQAEEAATLYTSVFPGSRVTARSTYPTTMDNPSGKPPGSVLTVEMELSGSPFTALNGGSQFTINPSVSFFVFEPDAAEIERMAMALVDGGEYLMPLDEYPWSPRYAWVQDRFGVSWQLMQDPAATSGPTIVPCLMFAGDVHGRAEQALEQYASIFPGGQVVLLDRYSADEGPEGTLKHGRASLGGQPIAAMDSHIAHDFGFDEAVSLQVYCRDQREIDYYWDTLSDGGEEGPCGWLKDRYGVSWQVAPTSLRDLMLAGEASGPGYERAFSVMLGMTKLDVAELQAAIDGDGETR